MSVADVKSRPLRLSFCRLFLKPFRPYMCPLCMFAFWSFKYWNLCGEHQWSCVTHVPVPLMTQLRWKVLFSVMTRRRALCAHALIRLYTLPAKVWAFRALKTPRYKRLVCHCSTSLGVRPVDGDSWVRGHTPPRGGYTGHRILPINVTIAIASSLPSTLPPESYIQSLSWRPPFPAPHPTPQSFSPPLPGNHGRVVS